MNSRFSQAAINALMAGKRQYAEIGLIKPNDPAPYLFNDAVIVQKGLVIDRYSVTGNNLEIGTAVAAELTVRFYNTDGVDLTNFDFTDAMMYPRIGVAVDEWGTKEYASCGAYMVDSVDIDGKFLTIKALDRMILFDKNVAVSYADYLTNHGDITVNNVVYTQGTFGWLLGSIAADCGVSIRDMTTINAVWHNTQITDILNMANLTYRAILQNLMSLAVAVAYMDYGGELAFSRYYPVNEFVITPAMRYSSSVDIKLEQTCKGICYTTATGKRVRVPLNNYQKNSSLFLKCTQSVISYVNDDDEAHYTSGLLRYQSTSARAIEYYPMQIEMMPAPFLEPTDFLQYMVNDEDYYLGFVTHCTYTMNGRTVISGRELINDDVSANADYNFQSSQTGQSLAALEARVSALEAGGGGGTLIEKTITENGVYNASDDNADGYSQVTVNVPQPIGQLVGILSGVTDSVIGTLEEVTE